MNRSAAARSTVAGPAANGSTVARSTVARATLPLLLVLLVGSMPYWLIQTQFVLTVCIQTLMFMAAAIAWNIISGFGGQLSFGHSAFFGIGAYAAALLFARAQVTPWLGMLAGGVFAAAAAVLIGVPSFRLRGIYFTLVTFTMTLIMAILAGHFDGFTGGHVGLSVPFLRDSPANLQFTNKVWFFHLSLALAVVCFLAAAAVRRSRLGYALRAIRDDESAAEASGVSILRTKLVALLLSAFLTGVVGVLYVQFTLFIDPEGAFGLNTASQIALPAIAGGLGTLWGPVVGATLLVPLQQFLNNAFAGSRDGLSLVVYGLVVIAVVLLDRGGIVSLLGRIASWSRRAARSRPGGRSGATVAKEGAR